VRIEGSITFDRVTDPVTGAIARVRLLDVTIADLRSRVVTEIEITDLSLDPANPGSIPFALESPELEPANDYSLSAHIDVNGNGSIDRGDYFTVEHHPVPPGQQFVRMTLRVRPVGEQR
jgi:uncharacterized lipoprotein YbaY